MLVWHLLAAPFLGTVRRRFDQSRLALVRGAVVTVLAIIGLGLILAAGLMGLALLIGPILASCAVGGVLLVVAALLAVLWKSPRRAVLIEQQPIILPMGRPIQPLAEVGFVLGFILIRTLLRRRG